MNHLTRNDFASALRVIARIEAQAGSVSSFAEALGPALNGFVACELTMLSLCDRVTGQSEAVGLQGDPGQRIGPQYAIAAPLVSDRRTQVSIVLNRRGLDFDERDRERLELLRPHLAFLYRHACHADAPQPPAISPPGLTQRETEVMHWLACGKLDAEIAALLSISRRTVQKHLEHIYVKLGVETRTAAVMRTLALCDHTGLRNSCDFLMKNAAGPLNTSGTSY